MCLLVILLVIGAGTIFYFLFSRTPPMDTDGGREKQWKLLEKSRNLVEEQCARDEQRRAHLASAPPSLPDHLSVFELAVAGHSGRAHANDDLILMNKATGHLLKPMQSGGRGLREAAYFTEITQSDAHGIMHTFLPSYYGVCSMNVHGYEQEFIEMENVLSTYSQPCLCDVKLGFVTYLQSASAKKIAARVAKDGLAARDGFMVLGQLSYDRQGNYVKRNRLYCYTRQTVNAVNAFHNFFADCPSTEARSRYLGTIIDRLHTLFIWFTSPNQWTMVGASVLLIFEGDARCKPRAHVKLIDFANTQHNRTMAVDKNVRDALAQLVRVLGELREEYNGGEGEKESSSAITSR